MSHDPNPREQSATTSSTHRPGESQDLALYFDPAFAEVLETWGIGNAWLEIQILLGSRQGRVLDLACGTGRVFDFLQRYPSLEYHGCDISDLLIERAVQRGIPAERLRVADATKMTYPDRSFDFVFSIGSIEHFTEQGIDLLLADCARICRGINFHQFPVSKSNRDEGWISPYQSYWNNSEAWWLEKFKKAFGDNVLTMPSRWQDDQSRGIWFISFDPTYAGN